MKQSYKISGMTCNGCRLNVESVLKEIPGIIHAEVDLDKKEATIESKVQIPISSLKKPFKGSLYNIHAEGEVLPELPPFPEIKKKDQGPGSYYCPMLCEGDKKYAQPGDCPKCGMHLVKEDVKVTKYTCPMHPEIEQNGPGDCPICGMALVPLATSEDDEEKQMARQTMRKFWIAVAFTLPIFLISMGDMVGLSFRSLASEQMLGWIQLALSIPVVFYSCKEFFVRGWSSIVNRSPNMWTLISLGAGSAYLFSLVALLAPGVFPKDFQTPEGHVHLYFEAATVILTLIYLGQVLEMKATRETNSAIRALINLVPPYTTIVRDDREETIPVDQVKSGNILRIKPGEKIPVDGDIHEGSGTIDESMITGEPIPITREAGEPVIGGTINGTGSFLMVARKVGNETLLSQIIDMVNKASRTRAPIQRVADRIASYFVPIVVTISIISFVAWAIWGPEPSLAYAFTSAVTVLIIACPCALGLATPMAIMVGTGKGAREGVLFKDARVLEELQRVTTLVVDKTGTLTHGNPTVQQINVLTDISEDDLLTLVASIESQSEHPLASAIVKYAQDKNLPLQKVEDFTSVTGKGIMGVVDNKTIAVGNHKMVDQLRLSVGDEIQKRVERSQKQGQTCMYVMVENELCGLIGVSDPIKESSKPAILNLQQLGLEVIMLTGDQAHTAEAVATTLKLDGFESDLLPEHKYDYIQELQANGKVVAMAGDGINDAPALAQANVGIAMGTGTDVAIESAGITLVSGDLNGIVRAHKLSSSVMKNIKQNLFFAFFYNSLGVPIAAGLLFPFFGLLLSPMLAALAMSLSSVSVIGNSLRLR